MRHPGHWGIKTFRMMDVTRRQALGLIGLLFGAACLRRGHAPEDWEDTCRRWMHVLIPSDSHGPGADDPAVWKELHRRLDADEVLREKIVSGLNSPDMAVIPADSETLDALFESSTPQGRFLNSFRDLLVTSYYSCETGWKDLGFSAPPQPRGYLSM
ncbi:MAG: hypothetical protein AB7F75_02445 [Planctomycetota bacterium]